MDRKTIITKKQITKKEYIEKYFKKGLLNTKNLKEFSYNQKTKTTTVVYAWYDKTWLNGYNYCDYTQVIEEHKDNKKTVKYFTVIENCF